MSEPTTFRKVIEDDYFRYQKDKVVVYVQKECTLTFATLASRFSRSDKTTDKLFADEFGGEVTDEVIGRIFTAYGDKSVGKMIDVPVIIEGIPIIDAIVIDDNRIGGEFIEASTRYLNFEYASFDGDAEIMQAWLDFYAKCYPFARQCVMEQQPRDASVPAPAYNAAVNAAALDMCREFLPMGMHTRLGIKFNFLTLSHKIHKWRMHTESSPILAVAELMTAYVEKHLPFLAPALHPDRNPYRVHEPMFVVEPEYEVSEQFLSTDTRFVLEKRFTSDAQAQMSLRRNRFDLIPKETELAILKGWMRLPFHIARELIRHVFVSRSAFVIQPGFTCEPLLFKRGTEDTQLLFSEFRELMKRSMSAPLTLYHFPMCTSAYIEFQTNLRELTFITELRTSDNVHPTMFAVFRNIAVFLKEYYHDHCESAKLFFSFSQPPLGRLEAERRALRKQNQLNIVTQ